MRAVEFKTRLKNNTILIPENLQKEIKSSKTKDVRVIVLINEADSSEESDFKNMAKEQFLKGYDDSDSVYDKP